MGLLDYPRRTASRARHQGRSTQKKLFQLVKLANATNHCALKIVKMAEIVNYMADLVAEALGHPLAVPISVGIATTFFTVVVFFSIVKSADAQKKSKKKVLEGDAAGGTVVVDGVRRSTRQVHLMSLASAACPQGVIC